MRIFSRIASFCVVSALALGGLVAPAYGAGGDITTVAGDGNPGYTGDGGPASRARVNGPRTLDVDPWGNVYIADTDNNAIRKISAATGVITTVAGTGNTGYSGDGGPGTGARLYWPHDVAADGVGNLYIADSANHRIRKLDPNGVITTIAGTGSSGYGGDGGKGTSAKLNHPKGVAPEANGTVLYIGDTNNSRIRKLDLRTGIITTAAGTGSEGYGGDGGPATSAKLNMPRGVVLDPQGNLYIADRYNYRVRRVDTSGIIRTVAGTGVEGFSGDGGPATSAKVDDVHGDLALDRHGNLYIPDSGNGRIRRVDALSKIITTIAGNGKCCYSGDGGPATSAALAKPRSAGVDPSGDLFIADTAGDRIRKVDAVTDPVPGGPGDPPPSDTEAPAASITAPADGATVSGTTTVQATAADNVGVTRVDFLVDGTVVASDTSSPFSAAWDTTTIANGSRRLLARARDAAGNVGISPAVTVTVSNAASTQLTFGLTDDATVLSASPNQNAGGATTLESDGDPVKDFLVRFVVSGVGAGTVKSARLVLHVTDPSSFGGNFYQTGTSWAEGGVTWNTAPAAGAKVTSVSTPVSDGQRIEVDITSLVTGDGTYALRVASAGVTTNGVDYASRNHGTAALRPVVVVTPA